MNISEAPRMFHFWTGVSVIAAVLQRKVWIDQKIFQWTPNFYIVFVGPPGVVTKSTTMRGGFKLLSKVPGIHRGPQSMTWQGMIKAFVNASGAVKIGEGDKALFYPMACITCDVSELGTFLKPTDQEMTNFLIDMWDGQIGGWKREIKSEDAIVIENPWLNIIGCTTPSWLRDNFSSTTIYGGLTSRCVFVWGEKKERLIAYPGRMVHDAEYERREELLINDLRHIATLKGQMHVTPEAEEFGQKWYDDHWEGSRPEHAASERFDGYWGRKQTHVHKLAMILSAAESDDLIIHKHHIELSIAIITGLEADMIKVFDSIGTTDAIQHTDEIIALVKRSKNKEIPYVELWQRCMRHMDDQQFQAAVNGGIKAQYLRSVNRRGAEVYIMLGARAQ